MRKTCQVSGNLFGLPVQDGPLQDVPEVHVLQHRDTSGGGFVATQDSEVSGFFDVLDTARVHRRLEVLQSKDEVDQLGHQL